MHPQPVNMVKQVQTKEPILSTPSYFNNLHLNLQYKAITTGYKLADIVKTVFMYTISQVF